MGEGAAIYTSAQLKVKFINFDCSATTHKGGIIEMSPEPPASCSAESQGVGAGKNGGKPADVYILQDPIIILEGTILNDNWVLQLSLIHISSHIIANRLLGRS